MHIAVLICIICDTLGISVQSFLCILVSLLSNLYHQVFQAKKMPYWWCCLKKLKVSKMCPLRGKSYTEQGLMSWFSCMHLNACIQIKLYLLVIDTLQSCCNVSIQSLSLFYTTHSTICNCTNDTDADPCYTVCKWCTFKKDHI